MTCMELNKVDNDIPSEYYIEDLFGATLYEVKGRWWRDYYRDQWHHWCDNDIVDWIRKSVPPITEEDVFLALL